MEVLSRIVSVKETPLGGKQTNESGYPREWAEEANQAFDEAVKQYLRHWIESGTVAARSNDADSETEDFIEHGALRSFFKHREDALELLLEDEAIARHLLRPTNGVYFEPDAYEPLLSKFEKRIYNLAAHREHLEVSFRYSSPNKQGPYGDTIGLADMPVEEAREDIGMYFGTKRSDNTALTILGDKLRSEALCPGELPIHVVTEGYMEDSLRVVKAMTEQLQAAGDFWPQCFVIQRRHAHDDRHLGAALLVMNPEHPNRPQRVIFCDTLNPSGIPPWWHKFKQKVDAVFPQEEGTTPISEMLEDGGVNLQRLHDGVPVRHQDIDCAFYTFSITKALIQLAKSNPVLILHGSTAAIVSQMTARIPEYFAQANQPKEPILVREENIIRRWNTGRLALQNIIRRRAANQ
jgi:hypothetical protein